MNKTILGICFLAMVCLCGCSAMLAKTSQLSPSRGAAGTPPTRGLRVTEVFPNSPAAAAGIHHMDLITQYGEFQIADDAGFFVAKNSYEGRASTVEIVVWRGMSRMSAQVRTGWLGVSSVEDDKVSNEFTSLMKRLEAMDQLSEHAHDPAFRELFSETPAKTLEKARALIDQAEREGTLTPTQVLVARIYMIPDDAPLADQRQQSELLEQLIATQPANYLHMMGNDKFFRDKRSRAAAACFVEYLKTSPDDVSARLNLAVAYNRVGMYEEANRAVDYVFEHRLRLGDHGYVVAYESKAVAALGKKEYGKSIQLAEQSFAIDHRPFPLIIVQFAAAQMGDMGKLKAAQQRFEKALPAQYPEMKIHLDAIRAYAMARNNQLDAAQRLMQPWKDTAGAAGRVRQYWQSVPDGMDVSRNFAELIQN